MSKITRKLAQRAKADPSRSLVVVAALVLLAACGDERTAQLPDDTRAPVADDPVPEVETADPVETFLIGLRAYNEGNLEELLVSYAPDAVWHVPCFKAPPVRGRRAVARQMVAFKGMLPDSRIGVKRLLVQDDLIVAQAVLHATHRWTDQGIPTEPKSVGYSLIFFVKTEQGKAQQTLLYFDQSAIRRQLGTLAGPAPAIPPWPGEPERVTGQGPEASLGVVKRLYEALEQDRFDQLDALTTGSFAFVDRSSQTTSSLAELKKMLTAERQLLDEVKFDVEQMVAVGPYVAVRFTERALYLADAPTAAERGRPVLFHGAHVFKLEGGKVAAIEVYLNQVEVLEALGKLKEALRGAPQAPAAPEPVEDVRRADAGAAAAGEK